MNRHAFISHASVDAQLAVAICAGLESRGLRCWIAPRDVRADGTYGTEIVKGLRESDVFVIVVTDASAASDQVEREAERASHYRKRIIPITVGPSEPGPRLEFYIAGRQYFPCPPTPDERFLDRLAEAVRGEGVAHPPAPAPVPHTPMNKRMAVAFAAALAVIVAGYWIVSSLPPASSPSTPSVSEPSQPPTQVVQPTTASKQDGGGAPPANPPINRSSNPAPAGGASVKAKGELPSPPARDVARAADGSTPPRTTAGAAKAAIVDNVRLPFVSLPRGTFDMGCSKGDNECEDDEKLDKTATIAPIEMSATEVTQEFWEAVMGRNPSDFSADARFPVHNVSWQDAQQLVERLNQRGDGFQYRLPREDEWEYAARANGSSLPDVKGMAWFALTDGSAPGGPRRVGTKKANGFGLFDMLGNVAEWCQDWYAPSYQRVIRGGAWDDGPRSIRLSSRAGAVPSTRIYSIGVRLVRTPQ